jgi:hypothetical protein
MVERLSVSEWDIRDCEEQAAAKASKKELKRTLGLPRRLLSFLTGRKGMKGTESSAQLGARQTIAEIQFAPGATVETLPEPAVLVPIDEQEQEKDMDVRPTKAYASKDFEQLMTLATGSFGAATLCRHKRTGTFLCLTECTSIFVSHAGGYSIVMKGVETAKIRGS